MKRPVSFYSEGVKLVGDVYVPDDLPSAPASCSATATPA
jgi:hypothetical protein